MIFCGPVRPANSVAPFIQRSGGLHSDLLSLAIVVRLFLLENEIKIVNREPAPAESNQSSFGGDTDRLRSSEGSTALRNDENPRLVTTRLCP